MLVIQVEIFPKNIQDHFILHRINNSFRVTSEISLPFNQDSDTLYIKDTIFGCTEKVLPLGFLVSQ